MYYTENVNYKYERIYGGGMVEGIGHTGITKDAPRVDSGYKFTTKEEHR